MVNFEESSYHGGAMNGKDCEKILMDAQSEKTINDCISLLVLL